MLKTLESPLDCKEIKLVSAKGNQPWIFIGRTDAEAEAPVLWPPHAKSWLIGKDWCWEGLGAGGEGDDRGWDGWMASLTRWTGVWVNSGSWWWTGRPGVLRFMGSRRVGHDWVPELNWTDAKSQLIGKYPDTGKDWRQEEKKTIEDRMGRWHPQFDGLEFEQTLRIGEEQGNLACYSPWGCRVGHDWATEQQQSPLWP